MKRSVLRFWVSAGFVLLACGSAAAEVKHQATLHKIQETLTTPNFRIVAQDARRKSEILTTATEAQVKADLKNAVHGMELRYTLRLNTVLIMLDDARNEAARLPFGELVVFYTVREKQGEKFPVDLGISFEFPEGNSITTLAQAKITEAEVDVLLSEKFKEDAGRQLASKLIPEFDPLGGDNGQAFKTSFDQFIPAFTARVLTQSRESLVKMLKQYPAAEQSILREARQKYGLAETSAPAAAGAVS